MGRETRASLGTGPRYETRHSARRSGASELNHRSWTPTIPHEVRTFADKPCRAWPITAHFMKPNPSQLRLLSDEDLDRELSSGEHDEQTRNGILYEKIRRVSQSRSRPHWINWLTLAVALVGAIFAGVAAWPVIEGLGETEWFDF